MFSNLIGIIHLATYCMLKIWGLYNSRSWKRVIFSTINLGNKLDTYVLYFSLGDLAAASARTTYQLLAENVDHLSGDLNLILRK